MPEAWELNERHCVRESIRPVWVSRRPEPSQPMKARIRRTVGAAPAYGLTRDEYERICEDDEEGDD
jgi:hypothetical protein